MCEESMRAPDVATQDQTGTITLIDSESSTDLIPHSSFLIPPLTLRQKVGHLIAVEVPQVRLNRATARFVRECHPAGVILFGRNLAGPWATARLTAQLQGVAARAGDAPLLIGIDQEGGLVARLRYPCAEVPSNMAQAAAGGPATAQEAATILGREMVRLGINLALAPVVDVNTNPANPVIGTRAYSDAPALALACGVAAIAGLRRAGALSMAKHFPGHGDTALDSHLALPSVAHGWDRLREVELAPFVAAIAAGVDSLCSAHVLYPGVDDSGLPATLSRRLMTDLLRGELGFGGALFADALVMDAIARRKSANIPPAAVAAIRAGVDCVMVLGSLGQQRRCYEALLAACEDGTIPAARLDEAVARVRAMRLRVAAPSRPAAWPDPAHQAAAQRLAHAAVTLVRDEAGLLPLAGPGLGVVEFAAGEVSPIESVRNEPFNASTLALLLGRARPDARFLTLSARTPRAASILDAFLASCERVVVATRNAAFNPAQAALLRRIAATGKPVVQLALRSPYDATLDSRIGTVLLTYGDQPNGVAAAVDVLLGAAPAAGRLPIRLDRAGPH
jgi:beta-N-acetylhexosaminidase